MTIISEMVTGTATHTLHELNSNGATSVSWDPAKPAEVDAARKHFDSLRASGYLAYSVDGSDQSIGEQIRNFDPTARQIIMSPQLQGG